MRPRLPESLNCCFLNGTKLRILLYKDQFFHRVLLAHETLLLLILCQCLQYVSRVKKL